MLDKIYIRSFNGIPDSINTYSAYEGFRQLGTEIAFFSNIEELEDISPTVGLCGFIGDVWKALDKVGVNRPKAIDYPEELNKYLGREVKLSTLGEARKIKGKIFVKPREQKKFNGSIMIEGKNKESLLYEDETEVWISELENFVSEYRAYVMKGEILGVRFYRGDWSKVIDGGLVERAVRDFKSAPAGYSLDFGVTLEGETKLVEVNDGYALGNYGLHPVLYARLIEARWEEMFK